MVSGPPPPLAHGGGDGDGDGDSRPWAYYWTPDPRPQAQGPRLPSGFSFRAALPGARGLWLWLWQPRRALALGFGAFRRRRRRPEPPIFSSVFLCFPLFSLLRPPLPPFDHPLGCSTSLPPRRRPLPAASPASAYIACGSIALADGNIVTGTPGFAFQILYHLSLASRYKAVFSASLTLRNTPSCKRCRWFGSLVQMCRDQRPAHSLGVLSPSSCWLWRYLHIALLAPAHQHRRLAQGSSSPGAQ